MDDILRPPLKAEYDVIVIGSGYGGGIAAARLAESGANVCVLERGPWRPPRSFERSSTVSLIKDACLRSPGSTLGSSEALYQIIQNNTNAVVTASGVGGGSLINAGVWIPTPAKCRKDPLWPSDWERTFDAQTAKGEAMLQPAKAPVLHKIARVMEDSAPSLESPELSEEAVLVHTRATISHEHRYNPAGIVESPCVACGQCNAGCQYNAKASVDKNYIAYAIKKGAEVHDKSPVLFVLPSAMGGTEASKKERRWRVYLNQVDYTTADHVVIAAGTFGTCEILLQSRQRGLNLPEATGKYVSSNGGNLIVIGGAELNLRGIGLSKHQLKGKPMSERPGPQIPFSYISSAGFAIQPIAIPPQLVSPILWMLFAWPEGSLTSAVRNVLHHAFGVGHKYAVSLGTMGRDQMDGTISMHPDTNRVVYKAAGDPLLTKKAAAAKKLAEKVHGNLYMFPRKTSVHIMGGARAGRTAESAVCNTAGQVYKGLSTNAKAIGKSTSGPNAFSWRTLSSKGGKLSEAADIAAGKAPSPRSDSPLIHPGLYVCDASLIPCTVGVNPIATIVGVSEHVAEQMVRIVQKEKAMRSLREDFDVPKPLPAGEKMNGDLSQIEWKESDGAAKPVIPKLFPTKGAVVVETLQGYLGGVAHVLTLQLHMGGTGRCGGPCASSTGPSYVSIGSGAKSRCCQCHDPSHTPVDASVDSDSSDAQETFMDMLSGRAAGVLKADLVKGELHVVDGCVHMINVSPRAPTKHHMIYHLHLVGDYGMRYVLHGKKEMGQFFGPGCLWPESTTLHCTLLRLPSLTGEEQPELRMEGSLRLDMAPLMYSIAVMYGPQKFRFMRQLVSGILRVYLRGEPFVDSRFLRLQKMAWSQEGPFAYKDLKYSKCVEHSFITGDGKELFIQQYPLPDDVPRAKPHYLVLINQGYNVQGFHCPPKLNEGGDIVSLLLKNGYEPWVLEQRYSGRYDFEEFNFDQMAEFDMIGAFRTMSQVSGIPMPSMKVHLMSHCMGGVVQHMAVMGGYITPLNVASMCSLSTSMFFSVNGWAMTRMVLPIAQICFALLGRRTILPTASMVGLNMWQKIVRKALLVMPCFENCSHPVCRVYSGCFGNSFWHENVSPPVHDYIWNHYTAQKLPLGGMKHLREFVLAGRLVDANGNADTYNARPERMAFPTTYISGGRPVLVTPDTSLRAVEFVRTHNKRYEHRRQVIPNYGHYDLMLGERMNLDVFPVILKHLERANATYEERPELQGNGNSGNSGIERGTSKTIVKSSVHARYDARPLASFIATFLCLLVLFLLSPLFFRIAAHFGWSF
eukprot:TRINITY_DN146_c0_g1_i1.p1 TRINITY_DN146_c0_g1~~TRINITY_DN146_c0_g1_i1.p1  ORF type:complete len:1303 (-),score=251.33 TRINITY_DN146_c0_g1_i1:1318-5226(-)